MSSLTSLKEIELSFNLNKSTRTANEKAAILKLAKARTWLMLKQPFFGALVFTMQLVPLRNIHTMGTDGKHLFYNPDVIANEDIKYLISLLAHEVWHKALLHFLRLEKRNVKLWNYATDYAINLGLKDAQFVIDPNKFLINEKYAGMSAEQIYEDLKKKCEDNEQTFSINPDHLFSPMDSDGSPLSEDEKEILREKISAELINAEQLAQAKGIGTVPGEIKELIKFLKKPKIDWVSKLHRIVKGEHPDDFTWARPHRKYLYTDLYLPSIEKRSVGNLYCWVDTSYSISNKEAEMFFSEFSSIINDIKPETVFIIECDTTVQKVNEFKQGEELSSEFLIHGRGGTNPQPFLDWVNENAINPQAILCFTDMGFSYNLTKPYIPVTWVSTIDKKPPFGELIYINENEKAKYRF